MIALAFHLLCINLLSINDIQSLLQGTEALALKVVDFSFGFYLIIYHFIGHQ